MSPRINIEYSRFLDPIFLKAYLVDNPDHAPLSDEELFNYVDTARARWKNEEATLVKGICEAMGLEFYPNAIKVHIVRALRGGFSTPLVLSVLIPLERFNDVLTHELIHILINDNNKELNIKEIFPRLYTDPNMLVRNHILVHAVHEYVYKDVLKDHSRYERDIKVSERSPAYKKAWDIVTERGYKNILAEFRAEYS